MAKSALLLAVVVVCALSACGVSAQHFRHCEAPWEFEAHAFQMAPKEYARRPPPCSAAVLCRRASCLCCAVPCSPSSLPSRLF